nr:MAG TPA: hypothetical protein [Inoviridae sp.]
MNPACMLLCPFLFYLSITLERSGRKARKPTRVVETLLETRRVE